MQSPLSHGRTAPPSESGRYRTRRIPTRRVSSAYNPHRQRILASHQCGFAASQRTALGSFPPSPVGYTARRRSARRRSQVCRAALRFRRGLFRLLVKKSLRQSPYWYGENGCIDNMQMPPRFRAKATASFCGTNLPPEPARRCAHLRRD